MLTHPEVQQLILDHDWTAADLELASRLLAHLDQCIQCRAALDDYDRLRTALSGETVQPDAATVPEPNELQP